MQGMRSVGSHTLGSFQIPSHFSMFALLRCLVYLLHHASPHHTHMSKHKHTYAVFVVSAAISFIKADF